MPYNCSTEVHLLVVNFLFSFSVLPPLAIEIGFREPRVDHNESQATFMAILEKDRQSEQTFAIRIQISTPRIQGVGEPATAFPTPPADFRLGTVNVFMMRLTPADNQTTLAYTIFEDLIQRTLRSSSCLLILIQTHQTILNSTVMIIPVFDSMVVIAFQIYK